MPRKHAPEGGYTAIPNHLIDEHMPRLTPFAWKIVVCVARQTLGWQRDEAAISTANFQTLTGLADMTVLRAVKEALEDGAIQLSNQKGERGTKIYSIAKSAREIRLAELRAMPYSDYLQTPEWQERRKKHLRYAGYRCQVCNAGKVELNVHHRTYERLGHEDHSDLIVLCRDCHTLFHSQGKIVA